ncbi:hypothetical protein ACTMTF_45055 [Nonomuraea sp. ZG12]|uniref:hypothetical protein n=1 Tax=Nonomuraea sp. ZG12 TaxID=3452207 RepID=UPI003F887A86
MTKRFSRGDAPDDRVALEAFPGWERGAAGACTALWGVFVPSGAAKTLRFAGGQWCPGHRDEAERIYMMYQVI